MDTKPDISKAPPGATHWAPEKDQFAESWYRYEGDEWFCVNDYWASDVTERPYGHAAKKWANDAIRLKRPMSDLISLDTLKPVAEPAKVMKLGDPHMYPNTIKPDPNAIPSHYKNILVYDRNKRRWDCVSVTHFLDFFVCYPYWMYQPIIPEIS